MTLPPIVCKTRQQLQCNRRNRLYPPAQSANQRPRRLIEITCRAFFVQNMRQRLHPYRHRNRRYPLAQSANRRPRRLIEIIYRLYSVRNMRQPSPLCPRQCRRFHLCLREQKHPSGCFCSANILSRVNCCSRGFLPRSRLGGRDIGDTLKTYGTVW